MADVRCRCCGVVVTGRREQLQRCPVCDICDGVHGIERMAQVIRLVNMGRITSWHAIATCAFDDAWLAGRLVIDMHGEATIVDPPKRWEIVIAWARCRSADLPLQNLVEATLAPFQNLPPSEATLALAQAELRRAFHAWNPELTLQFTEAQTGEMLFDDGEVSTDEWAAMLDRSRGSA